MTLQFVKNGIEKLRDHVQQDILTNDDIEYDGEVHQAFLGIRTSLEVLMATIPDEIRSGRTGEGEFMLKKFCDYCGKEMPENGCRLYTERVVGCEAWCDVRGQCDAAQNRRQ